MSYTRRIINGSTVSKEGGSSFDEELADLQDQIDGIGSGSVPTGTGLRHVTSGVEDGTAYALTTADMPFTGTPTGSKFLRDDQSWQTVSATNSFAGTYCGINSSQTITANTLTDVLWDEIISETANLSHTTGNATFTANLTQKYDIDIVVVALSSNTSGYTNGAYLALVVDGVTVAKCPHSLYNDTGSNWVNPLFIIMTTEAIAATKTFKIQFYPGIYNVDLLGKDSNAYRCTLRIRERGV